MFLSMPDTLTLLGHTKAGNLIFQTHDNTQYVCEQPVPGTAVWKNQNGNLHRAGKLSTVGPEFVLHRTACKCCGLQSSCAVCRSTDAAFETDFQTASLSSWIKNKVEKGAATVAHIYNGRSKASMTTRDAAHYAADNKHRAAQWKDAKKTIETLFETTGDHRRESDSEGARKAAINNLFQTGILSQAQMQALYPAPGVPAVPAPTGVDEGVIEQGGVEIV
jgi:hypothetical protein